MNGVIRSTCKITNASGFLGVLKRCTAKDQYRTQFFSTFQSSPLKAGTLSSKSGSLFSCKNLRVSHYSSNQRSEVNIQIQDFLDHEIQAEEEQSGGKTIPSKIDEFDVKLDGALVKLIKTNGPETIKLEFTVNNSVMVESDPEYEGSLISTPKFDIDITKNGTTLGFTCSFSEMDEAQEMPPDGGEQEEDLFRIDSFTIYSGEYEDSTYTAEGAVLDGNLYNLLMSYLENKGIHNEFISKISELSTIYEQTLYVSLLRGLKKFVS